MYLRERLKELTPGRFIEIGPGSGEITDLLLTSRWSGTIYDLSDETTRKLRQRFNSEIVAGNLKLVLGDFLSSTAVPRQEERADMIISCMVMEHLDEGAERNFMEHSRTMLKTGGRMIGLVPASPGHWGIEDDIAGHFRRYSRESLSSLLGSTGWKLEHVAGLTYPLSNLLLPISNYLVKRREADKLTLTALERTKRSGHRHVPLKTTFPPAFKLILNDRALLPLHWVQKLFRNSASALIMYFEATPMNGSAPITSSD